MQRANLTTTSRRVSGMGTKRSLAWAVALVLTAASSVTAQPVRLLVSSLNTDNVLRYDGATGTFIDAFVPAAAGGLNGPRFLIFDNDSDFDGMHDAGQTTQDCCGGGVPMMMPLMLMGWKWGRRRTMRRR